MKLKYSLETIDYVNFNLYHIEYTDTIKAKLKKQRISGTLLLVIVGLIGVYFAKNSQMTVALVAFGIAVYWYLNFPKSAKTRVIKSTEKAVKDGKLGDLFREVTIEINEKGISESLEDMSNSSDWSTISKIVEVNDYLYYFLENNNAVVVPKRIITEDELEELRIIAKNNYNGEVITINF